MTWGSLYGTKGMSQGCLLPLQQAVTHAGCQPEILPQTHHNAEERRELNISREMCHDVPELDKNCIDTETDLAYLMPSHYLNQCWNILNLTLNLNKLQRNLKPNSYIFIQENASEHVVWKMVGILSQPQCVDKPTALIISPWFACPSTAVALTMLG